jgi:hypothetical protein
MLGFFYAKVLKSVNADGAYCLKVYYCTTLIYKP